MKAGWRTSEFWLSLLGVIVPTLVEAFTGAGDPRLMVAGAAVSGAYSLARGVVKAAGEARAAAEARAGLPPFGGMTQSELAAARHPVPGAPGAH